MNTPKPHLALAWLGMVSLLFLSNAMDLLKRVIGCKSSRGYIGGNHRLKTLNFQGGFALPMTKNGTIQGLPIL